MYGRFAMSCWLRRQVENNIGLKLADFREFRHVFGSEFFLEVLDNFRVVRHHLRWQSIRPAGFACIINMLALPGLLPLVPGYSIKVWKKLRGPTLRRMPVLAPVTARF